jgi:Tfp pilus assembly protein PilO
MNSSWHTWKKVVGTALGLLFVADLAIGGFLYWQAQQTPAHAFPQVQALKLQAKKLQADVQRGERIRASLTPAGEACDKFYQTAFLDSTTGYSATEADLSSIASKAGLQAHSVAFKPKDLEGRGVTEVAISEEIEGDYPAILQFINGLEVSPKFYLLRDLTLDTSKTGAIRLKLELATYFRK